MKHGKTLKDIFFDFEKKHVQYKTYSRTMLSCSVSEVGYNDLLLDLYLMPRRLVLRKPE